MPCLHTVCVFDYPVPSPIRIFFWKTDVCGYARSDCSLNQVSYMHHFLALGALETHYVPLNVEFKDSWREISHSCLSHAQTLTVNQTTTYYQFYHTLPRPCECHSTESFGAHYVQLPNLGVCRLHCSHSSCFTQLYTTTQKRSLGYKFFQK